MEKGLIIYIVNYFNQYKSFLVYIDYMIQFSYSQLKDSHKGRVLNRLLEFGDEVPVLNKIVPYASY